MKLIWLWLAADGNCLRRLICFFLFLFLNWWGYGLAGQPRAPPMKENKRKRKEWINKARRQAQVAQRWRASSLSWMINEWKELRYPPTQAEHQATHCGAASPSFHSNNQPFNGGWLWMKWMVYFFLLLFFFFLFLSLQSIQFPRKEMNWWMRKIS